MWGFVARRRVIHQRFRTLHTPADLLRELLPRGVVAPEPAAPSSHVMIAAQHHIDQHNTQASHDFIHK